VATGAFADTATEKAVTFPAKTGRYLRLRALTEAGSRGSWSSAAEISATGVATGPLHPANIQLIGQASGKCVDIPFGATAPGAQPTLYTCNQAAHQRWTFNTNETLTGKDGVCLDGSAPIVTIQPCSGVAGQRWTANVGTVTGVGGKCLTPVGNGTANGVQLELAVCSGSSSQQWSYTP
jgi:alpha-glucosidase